MRPDVAIYKIFDTRDGALAWFKLFDEQMTVRIPEDAAFPAMVEVNVRVRLHERSDLKHIAQELVDHMEVSPEPVKEE